MNAEVGPAAQPPAPQPAAAAAPAQQPAPAAPAAVPAVLLPPVLEAPGVRDEPHPHKPQWRAGVEAATGRVVALGITVTPSDCETGRLRPPRSWYDALLGGFSSSFAGSVDQDTLRALGVAPGVAPLNTYLFKTMNYHYAKT